MVFELRNSSSQICGDTQHTLFATALENVQTKKSFYFNLARTYQHLITEQLVNDHNALCYLSHLPVFWRNIIKHVVAVSVATHTVLGIK